MEAQHNKSTTPAIAAQAGFPDKQTGIDEQRISQSGDATLANQDAPASRRRPSN